MGNYYHCPLVLLTARSMLVVDHGEWGRCDLDSRNHHSRAPCVQRYLVTNDGRDTRSAKNEHERQAVCILKSGAIVGHAPREFSRTLWKNIL